MRNVQVIFFLVLLNMALGQDSTLIEAIRINTYTMDVGEDEWLGDGAELLNMAAAEHPYLLVGEMHGIVEVGHFTKLLFQEASQNGFEYLAVETDPFIARRILELLNLSKEAFAQHMTDFPLTIPFYDNPSDYEMLKAVMDLSEQEECIWGIDQVFVVAPRYLFRRLEEIAPNEEAKKIAGEYREKGFAMLAEALKTMAMRGVLLHALTEEEFDRLYEVFGGDPGSEAYQIISGIQKSQEIYNYWHDGYYYQNNHVRSQLMKKQFMEYYQRAISSSGKLPKIIFKFGNYHMYRGRTPTRIYDIGNMVSEMAEAYGQTSYHISVSALSGESFNMLAGAQPFDNMGNLEPEIRVVIEQFTDGDKWIVIDTRAMRDLNLRDLSPKMSDLVYAFDALVYAPIGTPLETFGK